MKTIIKIFLFAGLFVAIYSTGVITGIRSTISSLNENVIAFLPTEFIFLFTFLGVVLVFIAIDKFKN